MTLLFSLLVLIISTCISIWIFLVSSEAIMAEHAYQWGLGMISGIIGTAIIFWDEW